jgi:hypothetical protein
VSKIFSKLVVPWDFTSKLGEYLYIVNIKKMMLKFKIISVQILMMFLMVGCYSKIKNSNQSKTEEMTTNTTLLTKNELSELVELVSQSFVTNEIKDSLTTLLFDIIHYPQTFDIIHKAFNQQQAPNMTNPNPTLEEWNAYNGDKKMWESANINYLLYEFGLTGNIDGFSGVVTTLQNSVHRESINFDNLEYDRTNFELPMIELNKELQKSKRTVVTLDLIVFIIQQSRFKRFSEIIEKTNLGKITTYNLYKK